MICIHLTCGNVTFDLDSHDDHKAQCEAVRGHVSPRLFRVECNYCGAAIGSPCRFVGSWRTMSSAVHQARWETFDRSIRRTRVSA